MLSSIIGCVCTFFGLLQYGFLIAFVASPFGGSAAALLAGIYLCIMRSQSDVNWQNQAVTDFAVSE